MFASEFYNKTFMNGVFFYARAMQKWNIADLLL